MDIGSAVGRANGISENELAALPTFETSEFFSADDKLVLRLAVGMTKTPVDVSADLFKELRARFSEPQLVELAAVIAWENYRARFNRSFAIEPQGFSEGAFCVVPERLSPPAQPDSAQ
jgi:alkylhydroperoxidase family enzyme